MAHIGFWTFAAVVVASVIYSWRKHQEKNILELRRMHKAFLESHKERWGLFYGKHKLDDGLSDEEILSRYVFMVLGELWSSPLNKTLLDSGLRGEILKAIAAAGSPSQQEIFALAVKIDREGRETRLDVRYRRTT